MSWNKNVVGYLTWFLYTLATGALLTGAAGTLCTAAGLPAAAGYLAGAAYAAVAGALVYGIRRLSSGPAAWKEKRGGLFLALEAFLVLALLAAGVFLRARQAGAAQPSSVYYDMAEVVAGGRLPWKVHGASHFYIRMLHLVFTLAGNQYMAGIWLQIVLQTGAFLGLFFVLRSLYGRAAALTVFGFGMCGPYMRESCMVLSPEILYFCIFTAALALAVRTRKGKLNPVAFLFAGILAAFCIYLDVAGVLILILVCWTVFCIRDADPGRRKKLAALGLCLTGALLGLLACVSIDVLASGKSFQGVITAWLWLYRPGDFHIPFAVGGGNSLPESFALTGMMTFGIYSFWCDRQAERISVWLAAACAVVLAVCGGVPIEDMPGFYYLYLLCTILAGLGVGAMFTGRKAECVQEAAQDDSFAEDGLEITDLEEGRASGTGENTSGGKQIKYIENPLPLPRKHVKRELDYPLRTLPENDDFDHPVSREDDFDI